MLRILRIYALKSAVDGSDFGELGSVSFSV